MSTQPHPRPSLRITGLHIERLKAIESLKLPEHGLGWGGVDPPVVLVGGMNGAGKTTLFEFICGALRLLVEQPRELPRELGNSRTQAWIDFEATPPQGNPLKARYLQGDTAFVNAAATSDCIGYSFDGEEVQPIVRGWVAGFLGLLPMLARKDFPGVVFLPSDGRDLTLPDEKYKAPGKLPGTQEFVYRWRPPKQWKDSLEALLYSLRWEDLNAKEEGSTSPGAFDAYAEEYRELTGGANRLRWHEAALVVESNGEHHALAELSSGEKQVLLLLAELRRHWRPGSLILIDEPELHLHDVLQARLYDRLVALQRERGGQVWLATQSGYLFEVAEPNTRVILKRKSAL